MFKLSISIQINGEKPQLVYRKQAVLNVGQHPNNMQAQTQLYNLYK